MKKIDSLLKRAELFEKLAVYGDRKSFLKALSQSQTEALPVYSPAADYSATIKPPTEDLSGKQYFGGLNLVKKPGPHGVAQQSENIRQVQNDLNTVLVPLGKINRLEPDGKLGDETIEAAIQFSKLFGGVAATPEKIREEALKIRNPELTTKSPF